MLHKCFKFFSISLIISDNTFGEIQDASALQMERRPLGSPLSGFFDICNTSSRRRLWQRWQKILNTDEPTLHILSTNKKILILL